MPLIHRHPALGRPVPRLPLLATLCLCLILFLAPLPAFAQTADPAPEAPPPSSTAQATTAEAQSGDVQALVRALQDPAVRSALAEALRATAAPGSPGTEQPPADPVAAAQAGATDVTTEAADQDPTIVAMLAEQLGSTWQTLLSGADTLSAVPQILYWLEIQTDPAVLSLWVTFLWQFCLALACALVARAIVGRAIRRPIDRIAQTADTAPFLLRMVLVPLHVIVLLLPVGAFAIAVNLTLGLIEARLAVRLAATLTVNAFIIARVIHALSQAVLRPPSPRMALLPMSEETGHYLYIWARRLTNVAVAGFLVFGVSDVLGLPLGARLLISKLFGAAEFALVVMFILQNRRAVADWLRGHLTTLAGDGKGAAAVARLGELWHVLAILYATALFLTWFLDVPGGFEFAAVATVKSAVIVLLAVILGRLLTTLIDQGFRVAQDLRTTYPGLERRSNRYVAALKTAARLLVTFIAFVFLLSAWGADSLNWVSSAAGQRLLGAIGSIALILVLAIAAWEVISNSADRFLNQTGADGLVVERSQRVRTLVPLARTVAMIFLLVIATLIILSEIGVNIGPLLAGAGVLGLAISFGSQKLVQDVITGAFCLIEDTLSVGDVVSVGGHSGVVEALSVRSIRLRDLSGSVHTVPFSTVDTVTNMTKDFSYYVMDVGVAYREDTDEVCAALKEVDEELRQVPEYAAEILEPIEILGVDQFADSAVVIKARLKTRPIKQWYVGREFNRRMKKIFDARQIEIPFPHTTLYFGVDKEGNAPPAYVRVDTKPKTPPTAPPAPIPLPPSDEEKGAEVDLPG